MRFKISGLFLAATLSAPAILLAELCDETFNLQSIEQTIWEGDDPKALQRVSSKTIPGNVSEVQVLNNLMLYSIITKFEGSCAKAQRPITLKVKPGNSGSFKDSVDNSFKVQMFDSTTVVNSHKYDYWFGFFKPDSALRIYLGRTNSKGPGFVGWYVGIYYRDSTKNNGVWPLGVGHYYPLTGPDDSVTIEQEFLAKDIRTLPASGASYGVRYWIQFLKVSYENKPSTGIRPSRHAPLSRFKSSQTGNLVLIQPGDESVEGQPLALYGMLGTKIATLHPTGFFYQWNGKTAAGADAPSGVYFIQAGNRVLGKFFYSR